MKKNNRIFAEKRIIFDAGSGGNPQSAETPQTPPDNLIPIPPPSDSNPLAPPLPEQAQQITESLANPAPLPEMQQAVSPDMLNKTDEETKQKAKNIKNSRDATMDRLAGIKSEPLNITL